MKKLTAQQDWNARKLYRFTINLKQDEDKNIIADILQAKNNGYSATDWIRTLYNNQKI